MLFGWPDLYLGSGSSAGNLSGFCLMGVVAGSNPAHPNAYLKIQAGWMVPYKMNTKIANNFLRTDVNTSSIITHVNGSNGTESYIFENRQKAGRDANIADSGIAIYRVLETATSTSIVLVEADGRYDLINGGGAESSDLWAAPTYTHFDFSTTPAAIWSDGVLATASMSSTPARWLGWFATIPTVCPSSRARPVIMFMA